MKDRISLTHKASRLWRGLAACLAVLTTGGGVAEAQTKVRFQMDFVPSGLYAGFF